MTFRKRLENSDTLAALLSWIMATYTRFCFSTTKWQIEGLDTLKADLAAGPVILVVWHQRLMFGPSAWPSELAEVWTLLDPSPAGRLAAATQARLGMRPIKMRENATNFAAARTVLKTVRSGKSLGIAADGPRGPNRVVRQAPVEWARALGCPVYFFAWSATRQSRLSSWDRLLMPKPFTKGAYVFQRWDETVPGKLDAAGYQNYREKMADALNRVTDRADTKAGVQFVD